MELSLKNIRKEYKDKCALDNLSITLTPGIYGLLGANGSGKTTLFRLICGLMQPNQGAILFNGKNIAEQAGDYRALLGFLPQDFQTYPDFTVLHFLLYIASLKGLNRTIAMQRSKQLLRSVGLEKVENKKIRKLSGGMKQRLGIAQALLNDPKLLILDEPTVGLDPKERVKFKKLLASISREKIVILSTHIVSDVENMADKILILKDGRLQEEGTISDLTEKIVQQVWECSVTESEADRLEEVFVVTNRRYENNQVLLKIVSESKPMATARLVSPTLEDLYLYYFREENQDDDNGEI